MKLGLIVITSIIEVPAPTSSVLSATRRKGPLESPAPCSSRHLTGNAQTGLIETSSNPERGFATTNALSAHRPGFGDSIAKSRIS